MNAIMKLSLAQREYDGRLPEQSDSAEEAWIDEGVNMLVDLGGDVVFQRQGRAKQGVTFEQFAEEVEQHAMAQTASASVFGRLILLARRKASSEAASAANEALNSADPTETLREIARGLLRPLAADGVIAQAEGELL